MVTATRSIALPRLELAGQAGVLARRHQARGRRAGLRPVIGKSPFSRGVSGDQWVAEKDPSGRGQDLDPVARRDPVWRVKPIFVGDAVAEDADPLDRARPGDRMRTGGMSFPVDGSSCDFLRVLGRPEGSGAWTDPVGQGIFDGHRIDPVRAPDSLADPIPEDQQGRIRETRGSLRFRLSSMTHLTRDPSRATPSSRRVQSAIDPRAPPGPVDDRL